jgi:hypothetical protein
MMKKRRTVRVVDRAAEWSTGSTVVIEKEKFLLVWWKYAWRIYIPRIEIMHGQNIDVIQCVLQDEIIKIKWSPPSL